MMARHRSPARGRQGAPRPRPRVRLEPPPEPLPGKSRSLLASIEFALDGIVYAVRHERNVKIHFVAAVLVLIACLALPLQPLEVLLVLGATCLILVSELLNTAIESVVNMAVTGHHPLAKIAKDVAAAAVLVGAFFSLAVAYVVLLPAVARALFPIEPVPPQAAAGMVAALAGITAVVARAVSYQGRFSAGGLIVGHAALAFGVSAGLVAVTRDPVSSLMALPFSAAVGRGRVASGLHAWWSILAGAAFGVLLTLTLFLCAREVVP